MTQSKVPSTPPVLRIAVTNTSADDREYRFTTAFRIGRAEDCDVRIIDDYVSRAHAEVAYVDGRWCYSDLGSSNGTFVNGERVDRVAIDSPTTLRFGLHGPLVSFAVEAPAVVCAAAAPGGETVIARYVDHYFGAGDPTAPSGEHTRMIRQAFTRVQKKQKRRYFWLLGVLGIALLSIGAYAYYLHRTMLERRELAENLFYTMKSLDVDIANLERLIAGSGDANARQEMRKYRERRQAMEENYNRFLTALKVYDPRMTEQQRLILRVARIFGECELAMPPDFIQEIEAYIAKWQSSGRYSQAIRTALQNRYNVEIASEMLAHGLPPQFFYLAMQESNFDPLISGPMTRKGIAKGMWQFIPETAVRFGMKLGPLVEFRRPDPADDRHHYDIETKAAARYLKELYSTDAQSSGLLVMACYNWGEDYVLPLVRKMPANPRERNFWRLLGSYREKLPKETYDYVFYIVSAAVIGENPRLFGFDFDNPLAHLESK